MGEKNKIKVNFNFHEQLPDNGKWKKRHHKKYLEYRRKWNENPYDYIVERMPIHLDIETSSIRNLRCPMCLCTVELEKGEKSNIKYGLMSWELYKKIIDEAARIGVYSIKLNWRGEPTLNEKLVDMVRYAKEKGILDIMINTNAVKLNKDLSDALINAGLDKIFFSIDSIDPDKYSKIRVGAKFEQVIQNIKYFAAYNEEAGHPVFIRIQKVLMTDTEAENEEFKQYFADIADQVAFEDYIPYGDRKFGRSIEMRGEKIKFSCSQLWQRLLITWDGECRACCVSADIPYILGNIAEDSIEKIWNGERLEHLREMHKKGEWYKCGLCKNCYIPYM